MTSNSLRTMEIYRISPFWDDEFKKLEYHYEPFNDPESVERWLALGFGEKICGAMCDMKSRQPSWNKKIIEYFESRGWQDVGTSYYCMTPGTVMPEHSDLYRAYIKKFNLEEKKHTIRRALILLEDWKPGHYLDCLGQAFVHWKAGDVVEWTYDTPHTAANIGMTNRYTLQVTGHLE